VNEVPTVSILLALGKPASGTAVGCHSPLFPIFGCFFLSFCPGRVVPGASVSGGPRRSVRFACHQHRGHDVQQPPPSHSQLEGTANRRDERHNTIRASAPCCVTQPSSTPPLRPGLVGLMRPVARTVLWREPWWVGKKATYALGASGRDVRRCEPS